MPISPAISISPETCACPRWMGDVRAYLHSQCQGLESEQTCVKLETGLRHCVEKLQHGLLLGPGNKNIN